MGCLPHCAEVRDAITCASGRCWSVSSAGHPLPSPPWRPVPAAPHFFPRFPFRLAERCGVSVRGILSPAPLPFSLRKHASGPFKLARVLRNDSFGHVESDGVVLLPQRRDDHTFGRARMHEPIVPQIKTHMINDSLRERNEEDEVARMQLSPRDGLATSGLALAGAGQSEASHIPVHPSGQSRAVNPEPILAAFPVFDPDPAFRLGSPSDRRDGPRGNSRGCCGKRRWMRNRWRSSLARTLAAGEEQNAGGCERPAQGLVKAREELASLPRPRC